jgi:acetyl-CoA carboxylase biotin carboxyl carrier protein
MADVVSPVTGSVFQVNCAVGDTVSAGDELIVLESMKMEVPVEAPQDGTVSELRVEVGNTVNEGDVLAVVS